MLVIGLMVMVMDLTDGYPTMDVVGTHDYATIEECYADALNLNSVTVMEPGNTFIMCMPRIHNGNGEGI